MPRALAIRAAALLLVAPVAGCGPTSAQVAGVDAGSDARDAAADGDAASSPPDSGLAGDATDAGAPVEEAAPPLWCPGLEAGAAAGYPAAHAPFPVVVSHGGGVLAEPRVITVTFPGDPLADALEPFGDDVLQTCWWQSVRQGACEGSGLAPPCIQQGVTAASSHVRLTTNAAASYTDTQTPGRPSTLQQLVQANVAAGTFPAPTPGTLYALYFPPATTVTLDAQVSCETFSGYHGATVVTPPGGTPTTVAYAVLPRCSPLGFSRPIDALTFAASHELTEAVTDPLAQGGSLTLDLQRPSSLAWNLAFGGELGDLCVDLYGDGRGKASDRFIAVGAGGAYTVQRTWSLAAAAAGGDPCVPVPSADVPYFNVAPASGAEVQHLAVGGSVSLPATAFSTGPLPAWSLVGVDVASALLGQPAVLRVTTDAAMVSNGDAVTVTVTLQSAPRQALSPTSAAATYLLVSQSGSTYHVWPGVVVSP